MNKKEKETLCFILRHKDGLIGQHTTYYGNNIIIKEVDEIVANLKLERSFMKIRNNLIIDLCSKLGIEGTFGKDFGTNMVHNSLNDFLYIKKKSILGFILKVIKYK